LTTDTDNLSFTPRPIDAVGLRTGDGATIALAKPVIQRLAALRAYAEFEKGRDWMEKLSSALTVALATRSADTYLMQAIQNTIAQEPPFECRGCRDATIGHGAIRTKLFPQLAQLREHANDLLHHLDNPENLGVDTLNIRGVFEYSYHLFQEQSEVLFGSFPQGQFEFRKCKKCRSKEAQVKT
jgi:hypothetical protein